MATYTSKLNLVKPELNDLVSPTVFADNFDKIDAAYAGLSSDLATTDSNLEKLNNSLVDINSNLEKVSSKFVVKTISTTTVSVPSGSAIITYKDVSLEGYKPIGIVGYQNSRGISTCGCILNENNVQVQYLHFYGTTYDVYTNVSILYEKIN